MPNGVGICCVCLPSRVGKSGVGERIAEFFHAPGPVGRDNDCISVNV